jgi:phage pi2 protein 07
VLRIDNKTLVDRRYYRVLRDKTFDTQMSADLYFKTSTTSGQCAASWRMWERPGRRP